MKLLYKILLSPVLLCSALSANAQIINAFAGNHTSGYSGNGGAATAAQCFAPADVAVDAAGNVYFCEIGNSVIRKVNTSGIISTVAGTGVAGFSGDGEAATAAQINQPTSVAVDDTGNIYFTDDNNNRIRKINTSGVISTIAGTGVAGFSDNVNALLGQLNGPSGVAVDKKGNVFIADTYNHALRKIDTGGRLSTISGDGTPGYTGDGSDAHIAKLNYPKAVCVDSAGYIYIVDQGNSVIRRINLSGVISLYAGNGTIGYSGDGGLGYNAALSSPTELAVDKLGNLYIAEFGNHVVRRVKPNGIINTVVGNGTSGYSGDGGLAIDATMAGTYGVAVSSDYKLYITDEINQVVRVVNVSPNSIDEVHTQALHIYPNPASSNATIQLPTNAATAQVTITDISGRQLLRSTITQTNGTAQIDVAQLQSGLYTVTVRAGDQVLRSQLTILK